MSRKTDLKGKKFGRLLVLSEAESNKRGSAKWLCQCECGTQKVVDGGNLRRGLTRSCGCLQKEITSACNRTHGMALTPTYQVWKDMQNRCNKPDNRGYKDYGGRGITVYPQWDKFENFYADMGERPDGLQIERRDNNKGYSPENCNWVTAQEQQRNKRNNRVIKYGGKSQCLIAWAEELKISEGALQHRLNKYPPQIAFNI